MTISKALADLESVRSIQFDNDILSTLNALASIGSLDNIVGYSDWQIPMVKCPECGPVMAVPRAAKDGDLIYCRSCKNELRLEKDGESFVTCSACPTGRTAPADKVQPQTDSASLEDFIHMAPRKLTINLNINRNRFG
jgi:ssDNA-binding Zn-finger/Zn-ribbon topoisomerase 1